MAVLTPRCSRRRARMRHPATVTQASDAVKAKAAGLPAPAVSRDAVLAGSTLPAPLVPTSGAAKRALTIGLTGTLERIGTSGARVRGG
jgi:hypothetical protein